MTDDAMDELGRTRAELASLERFLVWSFRATVVNLAINVAIYLVHPLSVSLVIAALISVNAAVIHTSIRLARIGESGRATLRFATGTWIVAAVIGVLVPALYPMTLLVAYLPLTLVIPHGSPRLQRVAFPICVSLAILIAVTAFLPPVVSLDSIPEALPLGVNVLFVSVLGGLFCLSVWGSYERVQRANQVLRRSHVELRESEQRLELRVAERTLELERSSVALAAARDEAVSANATKSRFLAAASHDLRQPIHALRLFAQALSDGAEERRSREIAQRMRVSADTLTTMFDELLDLSKLEVGAVEVRPLEFLLGPLLAQLASELEPDSARKGIELRLVETNASVRSDPILLRRILQNLLVNALRHTERGRVLVGCRRRGSALRVEVWDTGPGIPDDLRGEVFREFIQLPHGRRSEGLGLGLAIVDRLAKLLGSTIAVDSRVGRGSVFRIEVPLAKAGAQSLDEQRDFARMVGLAGLEVLVIDDDLQVLEGMRVLLEGWGCLPRLARSIEDAVCGLDRFGGKIDWIVADYSLDQGENGLAAIDLVRRSLDRSVPAIVITGEVDPQILSRIDAAGHVLLTKPIRPAKLRAVLASERSA